MNQPEQYSTSIFENISADQLVSVFSSYYHKLNDYQKADLLNNLNKKIYLNKSESSYSAKLNQITKRETEVLILVANGYSRKEIASCLSISCNTASRHIANLYSKLEINSVAEATRIAIDLKLVI